MSSLDDKHGEWLASLPRAEHEALNRGLSALETMADLWAAEINLGKMSETLAGAPDLEKRAFAIKAMVEQGFIEGAYRTFLDYKDGKLPGQSSPRTEELLAKAYVAERDALLDWKERALKAEAALSTPSHVAAPARQYYYRVNDCKGIASSDPDCICWHDEGTGPLSADEQKDAATWRLKDAPASAIAPIAKQCSHSECMTDAGHSTPCIYEKPSALTMTPEERKTLAEWHEGMSRFREGQDDFNGARQHIDRAKEIRRADGGANNG